MHNTIQLNPAGYTWGENVVFIPKSFGLTEDNIKSCSPNHKALNLLVDFAEEEGVLFNFAAIRQVKEMLEDAYLEGSFHPVPFELKTVHDAIDYVENNNIDIL